MTAQAGWYPDPAGATTLLRYWDGDQWTNQYTAAVQQPAPFAPEPVAKPAPVEPLGEPAEQAARPPAATSDSVAKPVGQAPRPPAPDYVQPTAQPSYLPYAQPAPTNGMAVASLVLGIAGLVFPIFICSLLAIIFAAVAKKHPGGRGMATAGLVLGIIGIVLIVLLTVLFGALIVAYLENPGASFRYRW